MPKGPQLNNIAKRFTSRDSLGIEGVSSSIAGQICPVVTNVTNRAFYWPFLVWIYYDFYKYSGIENKNEKSFTAYLRRQDYYFVLAVLLNSQSDRANLEGIQQTQYDIYSNRSGKYAFNQSYLKAKYGGMRNYNAGCLYLRLIAEQDPRTGQYYGLPKLTKTGEKMALAFEKVIKNTKYYKKYRLTETSIPETVLIEYGRVINIGLAGFDECKRLLREQLFEKGIDKLVESSAYIKYLNEKYEINLFDRKTCRRVLFDHQTPYDKNIHVDNDLKTISNEWEIVVGRQYFTAGLEIIWKYMLDQLDEPYTLSQWISKSIETSRFDIDLSKPLSDMINDSEYEFDVREKMISEGSVDNDIYAVGNGIRIILSMYNRFHNRADLGEDRLFFDYGIDNGSISFTELFEFVDEYIEAPIVDFITQIMDKWLIQQHYITAFKKMMQNRDGFYYEVVDGRYIKRVDFEVSFQAIRLTNLTRIMRDLDMI